MVLCLTHSNDFYTIDIVQQHVEELGMPTCRFNSDEFAVNYQLNYSVGRDNTTLTLRSGENSIRTSEVKAVWYRKVWPFKIPEDLDPSYWDVYRREYQTSLKIFLNDLQHIPWMNGMEADHFVGNNKLHQLVTARAVGIKIPETVFTNEPSAIKALYKQCSYGVVAKLHGALSKSMEGNTPSFPTTRIEEADLMSLDLLSYCPMIFQEYIPKAYELRVIYIDGTCYAGKIPQQEGSTDWRTRESPISWERYELPFVEQEKIHALMQKLRLTFGAIDIIKNTYGEYVFLEVNPQGEWGMLQKYLEYPIGETIAKKLVNRIKNV